MAKPNVTAPGGKVYDIPAVSFRIVTDDKSLLSPAGVHSEQARAYGYNDFSDFEHPEHYIRYIEPIESELAVQVEYDMDEQDQQWLDAVNAERKKEQAGPVSYEVFEIIMDKLEKEYFNLIKRIPQPVSHMPVEDSKCAICDDGEGENSNAIVFCDGCNLAVHQDCYGVPYIPEGQWLCRKCTVSPENPVSCLFCPNEGGAFKQTTTGHWSHLLCAMCIPELSVGNAIYMEPVEGVELVPKNRWKLVCSLCKERVGACIQCENKSCFTAFHVTCARQVGLLMSMKLMGADGQLKAYCPKHIPAGWRDGREDSTDDTDDDWRESEDDDEVDSLTPMPRKRQRKEPLTIKTVTPKTARAHAKSYRPGPPLVPRVIVNKLLEYVGKITIRKKQAFVERLCRYWSLKREARRGAPLLKRLHLEPWTASNESKEQTDAEKAKKLEFLVALRNDLEKVRLLAELVRKREKEKLRQAHVIQEIVDNFIFQHYKVVREILGRIVAMDKSALFLNPVSQEEVPDYYDVIKEPMSWSQMEDKLDRMAYLNVSDVKRDVLLVLDNAMVYNKSETSFHRAASRIKKNAQPVLAELDAIPTSSGLLPVVSEESSEEYVTPDPTTVGDLEPSLLRLKTLVTDDPGDPTRDLLASIFTFELEKPKEASPPPPTPPPKRTAPKRIPPGERPPTGVRDPARQTRSTGGPTVNGTSEPPSEAGPSRRRSTRSGVEYSDSVEPSPKPMGRPTRRKALEGATLNADGSESLADTPSSPGAIKPTSRRERGVLGVQSVPVFSDRERRERERQLDLVADNVDPMDQYKRFNVGWILPAGSKRKRAGPPPVPPPLPRKTSSLSASSLKDGDSVSVRSDKTVTQKSKDRESAEPAKPAPLSSAATTPRSTRARKLNAIHASSPLSPVDNSDELTPIPESALTSAASEHFPGMPKSSPSPPPAKRSKREKTPSTDPDAIKPGTLVWAKVVSFPYFPAVIIDPIKEAETVPQSVLDLEASETATHGKVWLARFFDKGQSWTWCPIDRLRLFGVDPALDAQYLAGRDHGKKKFRSSHVKASCKKAYELAVEFKRKQQ